MKYSKSDDQMKSSITEKEKLYCRVVMLPGFVVFGYYIARWCLNDNWISIRDGSLPFLIVCFCRLFFVGFTSLILYLYLNEYDEQQPCQRLNDFFAQAWNIPYSVSLFHTFMFLLPPMLFVLSFWDETIDTFVLTNEEIPNLPTDYIISMCVMCSYIILLYFSPMYKIILKPQLLLIYICVIIMILSPVSLLNYRSILPILSTIYHWYPDDFWKWGVFFLIINFLLLIYREVFQFSKKREFRIGNPMRSMYLIEHFLSFLSILLFSVQEEHEGKFMMIVICLILILSSGIISSFSSRDDEKSEFFTDVKEYPQILIQKFIAIHSVSMFLLFTLTIQVTSVCYSISCTTTRPLIPLNLAEIVSSKELVDSEKLSLIEAKIFGNLELLTWNMKLFVITNFNILLSTFLNLLCSYFKNELQDRTKAKVAGVRVVLSFLGMYVNHSDRAGHCHMVIMLALILLTAVELIHFQDDKRKVICLWKYYYYSDPFPVFIWSGIPILKDFSLRKVHHFLTFGSFLFFGFCSFSHMIHKPLNYIGIRTAVVLGDQKMYESHNPIMPTFTWVSYATEAFFFSSLYLYSCVAEYIPHEKLKKKN